MTHSLNLLIEIDDVKEEVTLYKKEDTIYGLKWFGYASGYDSDPEYSIQVLQNGDSIRVSKGSKIQTDVLDIKNDFLESIIELKKNEIENERTGIENVDEDGAVLGGDINPYNPELIRVDPRFFTIKDIYEMMISDENELDMSPEFQRNFVWNDITKKSRLIESLLLRIPLPVFYFAQDEEGKFKVIDGIQRLTVIKSFMNNEFKLKNLEYLEECEGKYFKKCNNDRPGMKYLDSKYVRRINQTQFVCNVIDPQTPPKVKFDIFKRINTGGKSLNSQEIRNCLANTETRKLLKDLSRSKEFLKATDGSISPTRMTDQELILRFIGFYYYRILEHPDIVYKGNMDSFLDDVTILLNEQREPQLLELRKVFLNSMRNAYYLFGSYAFRKIKREHLQPDARKQLLNKALFVTVSITLSKFPLKFVKDNISQGALIEPFVHEFSNNDRYLDVLTNGTGDIKRLNYSFKIAEKIIERSMGDYDQGTEN